MAKKKSWGINLNDATEAAKSSIRQTSHQETKKKPGPKGQEEEISRVQILVSSHKKLKKLAALADMKQLEYLSELVNNAYKERFGN